MPDAIKAPLILTLICAGVCGTLAWGNEMTKEKINAAENAALQETLISEFGNGTYSVLPNNFDGIQQIFTDDNGRLFFDVISSGYIKNGQRLLIGLDSQGEICGISVVSIADSPTQAKKVQDSAFLSQFIGKDEPNTEFDAISGATKSSQGIHAAVTLVLDTYQQNKEALTND